MKNKEKSKYNLKWIYAQTKGTRKYFVLLAIAGILTAVVNIGMTTALKGFVDIATGDSQTSLLTNTLFAVGFIMIEGLMGLVIAISYRVSTSKMSKHMRLNITKHIYRSDLLDIQSHHVGEFMTNVTSDVENVSACISKLIKGTVGNALTSILAIAYLFMLNWKLALMLLICIPLLICCIAIFSPIVQKNSRIEKQNEEGIRVYLQDILEKISIFKICSMGNKIQDKMTGLLDGKIASSRKLGAAEGGSSFLNNIMGTAMFMIAMGGGAYFVMNGELVVGAMIAVVQLSNYIIWPFAAIGDIISEVNQSIVSAQRLDGIYSLTQEKEITTTVTEKKQITSLQLNKVSFGYGETQILQNVDSVFKSDKIVGIIGESGGGKSTLLKVVSGLYQLESGSVVAEFADSTRFSESLRPYIGLVPADNLIFSDTIEANICMALKVDEKKMRQASAMANIDQYIDGLDDKYKTFIGDGKQALSSGQAQRVAIARTIYQGAEILLFDEPTANLDSESIAIFLQTLTQVSKGRICMVVTHDPRVIEHCDELLEVKERKLAPQTAVA